MRGCFDPWQSTDLGAGTLSDTGAPKPDWYPDPSGRFDFRYWDGETWTGHVSRAGDTSWDPPPGSEAAEAAAAVGGAVDEPYAADAAVAEPAVVEPAAAEPAPEPAGSEWAPQEAAPAAESEWAPQEAAPEPAAQPAAQAAWSPEPAAEDDTNLVAIESSGLAPDSADWLRKVAAQVNPRLDRIHAGWDANPQAEAARACAFGLLLGHLAGRYAHMRDDLSKVAEAHPSFSTLDSGTRLQTLEQIAGDRQRSAAWLGPLLDDTDPDRVAMLFD